MSENFTIVRDDTRFSLIIANSLTINLPGEMPGWFHRKMMSVFFGWKFKRV